MHRVWAFALLTACYRPGAFDRDAGMEASPDAQIDAPRDASVEGCPDSYQTSGSSRYRLQTAPISWFEAEAACEQDQAMATSPLVRTHLAIITTRDEQLAVGEISSNAFWVGYTDLGTEGAWHHITPESSDYPGSAKGDDTDDPWNLGEPNGDINENCAIIFSGSGAPKFDDRPCNDGTTVFVGLCECDANEATVPGG